MPAPIAVTHFTDPGCPWAYSAWPSLATLMWRYGDQLDWTHVMIGLTEDHRVYEQRGYTPASNAGSKFRFGRYGMPFATDPAPRVSATGYACRAVVAARRLAPDLELAVLRALQFTKFTTTELFDTEDGVRAALHRVPELDADLVIAEISDARTEELYQEDRARTRTAEGGPTEAQGKAANTDGAVRFTAPSVIFERTADGARLEAGGFQPLAAYDVCIANLDTTLARRPPAADVVEALAAFPYALTTAEVAAIQAPHLVEPDPVAAERELIAAVADGRARREGLGDGALWRLA
jgi:protein-disulfide isomerase-like protein with CxxC motif